MEIDSTTPSVFISSTVTEFRDLRSALAYTLRAQGFIVHLSEAADFRVKGDCTALDECFANIRGSDFYVLLVGGARGQIFGDGVSVTRQEYRVARTTFLSSGRPRLFLFVRDGVRKLLDTARPEQLAAGIDDPDHFAAFVNEVESPGIENAPCFLKRFASFEDVFTSLSSSMNLGRNLQEKLTRHALLAELTLNLTLMVDRRHDSVDVRHWRMGKVRDEVKLTPDDGKRVVDLTERHAARLGLSLVGRLEGSQLGTRCIDDALDRGVFLVFDNATAVLRESPIHVALKRLREDIRSLSQLDYSPEAEKWDVRILDAIGVYRRSSAASCAIAGLDLARAFAHYDGTENVFQEHLAICRALLGTSSELETYQRRPLSPFGEREDRMMHAERVSGLEIAKLIQNDIWPLGKRVPSSVYGKTREEQLERIAQRNYELLADGRNDPTELEQIRAISRFLAEQWLNTAPLPADGIENLEDG